jgi:tRNA (cytidine/uridine-2'-O-)-methyltransferase
MIHIVLYQPEIPPNTGNIMRLCHNTGAQLHLIRPMGFDLDHQQVKRAGLDYIDWQKVKIHDDFSKYQQDCPTHRLIALTTKGQQSVFDQRFAAGDALLFGPESRGLPADIRHALPIDQQCYLPMQPGSRSLNLSNAVAISLYEAWRQLDFCTL